MGANPFWIHDPTTVTVCDEFVYALVVTLDRQAVAVTSIWSDLAPRENPGASVFEIPILPPIELSWARKALGATLDDLQWLRGSLLAYAQDTAHQERAGALAWAEPAERALALGVSLAAGGDVEGALGSNPIAHAAQTVGGAIPPIHEVVVSESLGNPVMAQAPRSLADRVARIPETDTPIRIERYVDDDGNAHSEVYIAGTHDWGMGTSAEPFDMNSNIALVAGIPAASLIGVQSAMARAGIRHGEKVTFTGHSQGGIIAARLAESGTYRTTGLVVVGSPTGTLSTNGRYPALALRHTDDVVPRLGGSDRGSGFTTIERHSSSSFGDVAGAHEKSGYLQMAKDLDSSPAAPHLPEIPTPSGTTEARVFSARRATG
ncbi:MAG: hypothetical protein K9G03_01810 [Pontimonas sp.]|nr:hypothetical protein [Pontimonas sp.]